MNGRMDYTVCQWRISGLIAGVGALTFAPSSPWSDKPVFRQTQLPNSSKCASLLTRKEQATAGIKHRLILGGWASDANAYFFYLFPNLQDLKYVSTENPHRPVKGISFATRDYFFFFLGTPANFLLLVTHKESCRSWGPGFFIIIIFLSKRHHAGMRESVWECRWSKYITIMSRLQR